MKVKVVITWSPTRGNPVQTVECMGNLKGESLEDRQALEGVVLRAAQYAGIVPAKVPKTRGVLICTLQRDPSGEWLRAIPGIRFDVGVVGEERIKLWAKVARATKAGE